MKPEPLHRGEIVQIHPHHNASDGQRWFGGTLLVVTERREWGALGYVLNAGDGGPAYYRCKFEHMERTGGMAFWMYGEAEPGENGGPPAPIEREP